MPIERTQADYLHEAGATRAAIKRLTELGKITPDEGGELLFSVYQKTIDADNTRCLLNNLRTDAPKRNEPWDFTNVHTPWQFLDTLTEEGYLNPDLFEKFNNTVDTQRRLPAVESQNQSGIARINNGDQASLRSVLQLGFQYALLLRREYFPKETLVTYSIAGAGLLTAGAAEAYAHLQGGNHSFGAAAFPYIVVTNILYGLRIAVCPDGRKARDIRLGRASSTP